MKNFLNLHLDLFGFFTSMLCAVHCAAVPMLLTVSTWSGLQLLDNPSIEVGVLCASLVLALLSIFPSYLKIHKRLNAIAMVGIGFILLGLSRLIVEEVWEVVFTSAGATLVALAHIVNWKLCRACASHPSQKKS
jgi:MerC mercury resistance protein